MTVRVILVLSLLVSISSADFSTGYRVLQKIYDRCQNSEYLLKCFKVQALKITNRASNINKLNLMDGISIVRKSNESVPYVWFNDQKLKHLNSSEIDRLLYKSADKYLNSHTLDISIPGLAGEGRGAGKKTNFGPLLAAMAIKGGFMAVAFKGIAATAGAALLIGKMALILCAIMGLKKLIGDSGEKTTLEIVKHPMHSSSHTYSNSYEDDGGHYHRSISSAEDMLMAEKMLHSYKPYAEKER